MKELFIEKILDILNIHDVKTNIQLVSMEPSSMEVDKLVTDLMLYSDDKNESNVTVLGIDIYKYSKFEYERQKYIPLIFGILIKETIKNIFQLESNFSLYYKPEIIESEVIDTGDGGYLVFQNPIDAVIFAIYFNANLHSYNSFHFYPKLRKYIGSLTIRYAITLDKVYKINNRFYGPGIIKNARIMSCDKLNRLLIDGNTYEWFLLNTNGIENITVIDETNLFTGKPLEGLTINSIKTLIFQHKDVEPVLQNVFCQKLEKINIKDENFDVFNLIIQTRIFYYDDTDPQKNTIFTTTIGNMNCNGI